jgi:hypothetical protein
MTDQRTFDETISAWLDEAAPSALPEHVLAATFERTRRSRQGFAWPDIAGRLASRRRSPALGGAAAVVVAAVILALNTGLVLGPGGQPTPSPSAAASPSASPGPTPGYLWPQTTLEEVEAAQKLADAGDPTFRWQVSARSYEPGQNHPFSGPFFGRFLEDELGWEAFRWNEELSHSGREGLVPGDVVFIRCAPDAVNPLYPDDEDGCRPTLDPLRYETVKIHVAQPVREDATGIWVVTGWEMDEPAEQIAPPSDAEVKALLEAFFRARTRGEPVDAFVQAARNDPLAQELASREIPLLRTASAGAPYVRWDSTIVGGPVWPTGRMEIDMTLFTETDRTRVTQRFSVERDDAGRLHLVYASSWFERGTWRPSTTENGNAVPVTYRFLDGELTYRAAAPLTPNQDGYLPGERLAVAGVLPDDDVPRTIVTFLANPRPLGPGCADGPAPADAAALARSLGADPDLQATTPVAVTIGGRPALRMDVARTPRGCRLLLWPTPYPDIDSFGEGDRVRIHLVDLPGSSARILAILTKADADSFETVLAWAAPIIASIEFRGP